MQRRQDVFMAGTATDGKTWVMSMGHPTSTVIGILWPFDPANSLKLLAATLAEC